MQVLSFFPLLALTAGQDWTCEECVEGGALVGAYASTEKAIADQTAILLAEVCPSASDPEICLEKLPDFWSAISVIMMPIHYSHICDDRPECPKPPPPKVKEFVQCMILITCYS